MNTIKLSWHERLKKHIKENDLLSDEVWKDITNAKVDLQVGPLYLDADGEQVDCFEPGAKRWDCDAGWKRIRHAVEVIELYHDFDDYYEPHLVEGDEGEILELPADRVGTEALIEAVCGRDLSPYVRGA